MFFGFYLILFYCSLKLCYYVIRISIMLSAYYCSIRFACDPEAESGNLGLGSADSEQSSPHPAVDECLAKGSWTMSQLWSAVPTERIEIYCVVYQISLEFSQFIVALPVTQKWNGPHEASQTAPIDIITWESNMHQLVWRDRVRVNLPHF